MEISSSELKIGEVATITSINLDEIPLKLLEMGCLHYFNSNCTFW